MNQLPPNAKGHPFIIVMSLCTGAHWCGLLGSGKCRSQLALLGVGCSSGTNTL